MESKFTKGPWKFAGLSESGANHFKVTGTRLGGRFKIARVPFNQIEDMAIYNDIERIEAEANAKLIAASPDLLKACQDVVGGYEGDGMEQMELRDEVFYRVCKDALSKALD